MAMGNPKFDLWSEMIEIKFQGRGGQGVVVASQILAQACFEEGKYPQCFSIFGGERRGAPVAAFVRISDQKIYLKCDIERPNHLIVFDDSPLDKKGILDQLLPGGTLLLNSRGNYHAPVLKDYKVGMINALEISKKNGLGAIVNTAILGAYVRLSGLVGLDAVMKVITEKVPTAIDQNLASAKEAYEKVLIT